MGLASGDYTVIFKDENNCTTSIETNITEPEALVLTASATEISCNSIEDGVITVSASGGTLGYEYSIDGTNFSAATTFSNLSAGNYTVVLRDANGCEVNEQLTIAEPPILAATLAKTNITCNGENDGVISFTVSGGTGIVEASIDGTNFQTTDFMGLASGDYTVTFKDENDCIITENETIDEPDALLLSASFDGDNINLSATGGTTPYNYSTDGSTFQTESTFTLPSGQYTFTVRDDNACEATTTHTLVITALDNKLEKKQVIAYPNPVTSEIYLQSPKSAKEVRIIDKSGRMVFSDNVDKIETKLNISHLEDGVYTLLIINNNGDVSRFKFVKQ